jgi:ketosteroid isomerase-like protein
MKTLKSILAGIVLLFACAGANAAVKTHASQPTESDVVTMYINAIKSGTADKLDKVLDNDLEFNIHRGEKVNTLNKEQLIDYLKSAGAGTGDVNATTTVLAEDENTGKVKIEFKYADYTRTDIVSLSKSTGWKITSVNSTCK